MVYFFSALAIHPRFGACMNTYEDIVLSYLDYDRFVLKQGTWNESGLQLLS